MGTGLPESAGECGPDEPGVSAAEDLTQAPALRTAPDAVPEDLSADPVIEWVEFDPGIGEVAWLKSVGDGRVQTRLAKFTTEKTGDNRTTTTQTSTGPDLVTSDGIRWDELPLPEGIDPHIVDISSDLWLVTERPTEILFSPARVFVSRDRGATWLEVPVDSAPLVPHTVEQHLGVSAALVSDGFIVLSANIHSLVDAEALLLDRGLISESQVAGWLSFSDDILTAFVLSDPEVVEGIRNKTRTIWQTPFGREDIVEFTAEELDLTARQRQLLERPIPADPLSEGTVRIYSGDESGIAVTAEYTGNVVDESATPDGFLLYVRRPRGLDPRHLLIASPDGRSWSERSLDVEGESVTDVVAEDERVTIWRTNLNGAYSRIQILCHDGSPTRDVVWEGLALVTFHRGVSAGPAGFVALAKPLLGFRSLFGSFDFFPGGVSLASATKDGYELRIGEPGGGGLTLWDLEEDEEIYAFEHALFFAGTPDGVRESGVGETFAATFEDPETGADLVTFTWRDLSERPANQPQIDTWVGWSADGVDWEWQAADDIFGTPFSSAVNLAVGSDFLLAYVRDPPARWFIAKVPDG